MDPGGVGVFRSRGGVQVRVVVCSPPSALCCVLSTDRPRWRWTCPGAADGCPFSSGACGAPPPFRLSLLSWGRVGPMLSPLPPGFGVLGVLLGGGSCSSSVGAFDVALSSSLPGGAWDSLPLLGDACLSVVRVPATSAPFGVRHRMVARLQLGRRAASWLVSHFSLLRFL